jgi:hypothetical protein
MISKQAPKKHGLRKHGPKPWKVAVVVALPSAALLGWAVLAGGSAADIDPLVAGSEALVRGELEEAAKLFESPGLRGRLALEGKYNAGVSLLRAGKVDEARSRFEEVSALAEGPGHEELRAKAFYNLGRALGLRGAVLAEEAFKAPEPQSKDPKADPKAAAPETPSPEDPVKQRLEKLSAAAQAYHGASEFFHRVEPIDADTAHNIAVVKTALRRIVDEVARIEAEEKRKAEEKAIEKPAQLLVQLVGREKTHLGLSRALAQQPAGQRRVGSRRLRKAEAEVRVLTEKLRQYLEREPAEGEAAPAGALEDHGSAEAEKARRKEAASVLAKAIEAQKEAEVAHAQVRPHDAAQKHLAAARELRAARVFFPLELPQLVSQAIATQEAVIAASGALEDAATGGLASQEVKAGGFGKQLLEALKDKVLEPVARLLNPSQKDEVAALADEEDDVVWAGGILAQAEIAATPGPPPGAAPQDPSASGAPQLSEEDAKKLSEAVRKEGAAAKESAAKAHAALAAQKLADSVPHQKESLEALRRLEALLPKPPEPPEERLQKLIARQKEAETTAAGIPALDETPRREAAGALASSQRGDGAEAEKVREELSQRQGDEKAQKAAEKVQEGAVSIFSSAEALDRLRSEEAKGAITKAVASLEEALAILSGKGPEDEEKQQDQDEQQGQQPDDQQKDDQKQPPQEAYALSPRQARMLQEEMDRKRRQEEAKLFRAPSSVTVERDW